MPKRPRGEIARQAEQHVLSAVWNAADGLENDNAELAAVVRAKHDQIAKQYETQARLRDARKSTNKPATEYVDRLADALNDLLSEP